VLSSSGSIKSSRRLYFQRECRADDEQRGLSREEIVQSKSIVHIAGTPQWIFDAGKKLLAQGKKDLQYRIKECLWSPGLESQQSIP
jgi:hypothetical protein